MSTKPGATISPEASIVRAADSSTSPIWTKRPSSMPTSARRRSAPVPSTTLPPAIFTSSTVVSFRCVPEASLCCLRNASWKIEQLGRLVARRDRTPDVLRERGRLAHELLVGRCARSGVVLQPDAQMPASLQRDTGDAALQHVAAEHGDRPRHVAAVEQLEIRVEGGGRRPQPRSPPREHATQKPGLVNRHARTEPEPLTETELVRDVVERVGIDDPRRREPVCAETAEVHRPGVTEREAHE